ncbi:unnamed protein product [Lymnaea stagnalis]|uniref:Uncharacterized protein n=1 Tax=Lymnaea stagnalis TaxID=6523 RepID=A0AAV2H0M6_LYMST
MEEIKCDGKESIGATGKNDNSDNQLIDSQFDENVNLESQRDQDFTPRSILDGGDISHEVGNGDILDTENGKSLTSDNLDTENGKSLTSDNLDTENGKLLTSDILDTENGKSLTSDNLDTENMKLLTSTEKEDELRSSESEIAKGTEDLLTELGNPGKFVICQILLHFLCVFGMSSPALIYVFIGYEPPHKCRKMTNESTYLASYELPNSSVHLVYDTCSISVVRNSSGEVQTVDTIGCIQGNDYGGQQHISFVAEVG